MSITSNKHRDYERKQCSIPPAVGAPPPEETCQGARSDARRMPVQVRESRTIPTAGAISIHIHTEAIFVSIDCLVAQQLSTAFTYGTPVIPGGKHVRDRMESASGYRSHPVHIPRTKALPPRTCVQQICTAVQQTNHRRRCRTNVPADQYNPNLARNDSSFRLNSWPIRSSASAVHR